MIVGNYLDQFIFIKKHSYLCNMVINYLYLFLK